MKVLLIDVNCKQNSTGILVYQIYQHLSRSGIECAVCYGRGEPIHEPNIYKFGIDFETNIHAALTRITGYTGCFSYLSTWKLIRFIEAFNPDIVHIHELHAYFVNIKQLLIYLGNKKIHTIFTLHCEFYYTGKCGYALECDKWKMGCGNCPHLGRYIRSFWFDRTHYMWKQKKRCLENMTNAIITTVSPWLTERARMSFLKSKPIYTILNGVDINVFYPRETSKLKEEFHLGKEKIIVSVAAHIMNPHKGGEHLVKLAHQMQDYLFILIGTDEKQLIRNKNIIFVPKLANQKRLAEFYSLGDVFVLCSKKETFSLPCAEALCCGTPVVGFKCGAPEMIFEEPYAHFVDYGNYDGIKLTIEKMIYHKPTDIAFYARKFSNTFMNNNYMNLYKMISDL